MEPNYDGKKILNYCNSEECKTYLLKLLRCKFSCSRQRLFYSPCECDQKELKSPYNTGFGPLNRDTDLIRDISASFVHLYHCNRQLQKENFDWITYVFSVWIPEAIILALQKVYSIEAASAEKIFRDFNNVKEDDMPAAVNKLNVQCLKNENAQSKIVRKIAQPEKLTNNSIATEERTTSEEVVVNTSSNEDVKPRIRRFTFSDKHGVVDLTSDNEGAISNEENKKKKSKSLENNQQSGNINLKRRKPLTKLMEGAIKPKELKPNAETIDPVPDVKALFRQFNIQYFFGKLNGVEVQWSPRMTRNPGRCNYESRRGLLSVRLSEPLLKFRPRKDLVQTLLLQMIHAYLFVTANIKDFDAIGDEFLSHMHRINKLSGANITVNYDFQEEINYYKKVWWRCDGPCQKQRPYFGYVERSMNRAPGQKDKDWWFNEHEKSCGGKYHLIKEPEGYENENDC